MTPVLREATRGLLRTGSVGALSVLAIAASLLMLGVFGQVVAAGSGLAREFRQRVEVDVYLREGTSRSRALNLVRDLEALPGIANARYVDKAAAAEEFRHQFGEGLLDALSVNPLPASIRVRVDGESGRVADLARGVADALDGRPGVEGVETGEAWLESFDRFLAQAMVVVGVLAGALCLACFFAVGNTAKLMVLAQRDAIEVMRLVGATGRTVRLTFLTGGALLGGLGGLTAVVALWAFSGVWREWIPVPAEIGTVAPMVGAILLGPLMGLAGSWASLNRVLRAVSWRP